MGRNKRNKKHTNYIWQYGNGRIALYTEDPIIWEKIRRSYSTVAVEMTRYYRKGESRAFARQYLAPTHKRATFEKMFGGKMEKDG